MARVDINKTCAKCAFNDKHYCVKYNTMLRTTQYACGAFKTKDEYRAEREAKKQERVRKEEQRLNFILTGLYIMTTASTQILEYFDSLFQDKRVEETWRFERKRAANEIDRCVQRIRDIYQHSFMRDQMQVMTGNGTREFDAESYDNHEDDARRWCKLLLHHMDGCWQNEGLEEKLLAYYESLPHIGIFEEKDFRHFTTKR